MACVIQGVFCSQLTENMEYRDDINIECILLFVLPCLNQVLLFAAFMILDFISFVRLPFLNSIKMLPNYFCWSIKYLMVCLEEKFILALQFYCYCRERVLVCHVSMYCVQRKYHMGDFFSLTVISYRIMSSLGEHLASACSLLNCQMSIKYLLSLNFNSAVLTSQKDITTLICWYWRVPVYP